MLVIIINSYFPVYRDGRHLTDDEIAGMLIGLLLAGQHTSSTTGSWLGFFLAKHPDIQVDIMALSVGRHNNKNSIAIELRQQFCCIELSTRLRHRNEMIT